jgi:hypothetical protein
VTLLLLCQPADTSPKCRRSSWYKTLRRHFGTKTTC